MKRFLILLLCLLLAGCAAPVETPAQETDPSESRELRLVINDGHVEDPWDWNWFYHVTTWGEGEPMDRSMSIHITNIYPDAGTFESTLSYDGSVYTLKTEDGIKTYPYLIYSPQQMPPQSEYDYAEHFLLSQDPDMTYDRYFKAMLSSAKVAIPDTWVVYTDYLDYHQ